MKSTAQFPTDKEQQYRLIYDTAARLFHRNGYAQTPMSEIARAVGLTKAGLYHYIESKEQLLFGIVNYGLDLLRREVIEPVEAVSDPRDKLRTLIGRHIDLILQNRSREITVILHENRTLQGELRTRVNARKKEYIALIRAILTELRNTQPDVQIDPRVGTFALLGMLNWLYQWYRLDGPIPKEQLSEQFTELFLKGYLGRSFPTGILNNRT